MNLKQKCWERDRDVLLKRKIRNCWKMERKKYVDWTASETKKWNRRGGNVRGNDREKNVSRLVGANKQRSFKRANGRKKATNASPKSTVCTDWKTIYQYYCRKISCTNVMHFLLCSFALAFWLANMWAECRVAVGFNGNRTERMSAHWFG